MVILIFKMPVKDSRLLSAPAIYNLSLNSLNSYVEKRTSHVQEAKIADTVLIIGSFPEVLLQLYKKSFTYEVQGNFLNSFFLFFYLRGLHF